MYDLEDAPDLDKKYKHDIEIVVDRLIVKGDIGSRLADSLETALGLADGIAYVDMADAPGSGDADAKPAKAKKGGIKDHVPEGRTVFSAKFACPISGFTIDEIEPRLFSFNNPFGACPACDGLGTEMFFDAELVVPDDSKSLNQGAIAPWAGSSSKYYAQTLESLAKHYKFRLDQKWADMSKKHREILLFGSGTESVTMRYKDGSKSYEIKKPFEGVVPNMERRWRETDSNWVRDELQRYQTIAPCETCKGKRLRPEALAVRIDKRDISDVCDLSIEEAADWFEALDKKLTRKQIEIARRILREINDRLHFLRNVGLEYLTLSRASGTLSGGESQRIRLASQIGSGLTGVLYVLDEPSIGLHQRDNERLLKTLERLRDIGNTVIVVEHDEEAIRAADYVVDMGPRAGIHGGKVVCAGLPKDILDCEDSLTGRYLSGKETIPLPTVRRPGKKGQKLTLTGATSHNLQGVDVSLPLGTMICITGVSGGGKSSLIIETLYKALARKLMNAREIPGPHTDLKGIEFLDKVVDIDQSPIGRTPRSNPATYTGAFTPIRDWFTNLPESKTRGYKAGRFSFNVKGGRCEACQGDGLIKIEMHFLPDVYVECDVCKGARYNRETLEIKFRGKSIAEVLDLTVDEAADFFKAVPSIRDKMVTLQRVGLGYIHLGQQATTLSGGEAQRVKLAKELSRRATGKTVYILDEPTTGLHFDDVRKLLEVLDALVEQGNTVIVIEHNLEVIKTADWIVDLGPEGGIKGGHIVAEGTPEDVAKVKASFTGHYLAPYLARKSSKKKAS
jgi:excinuclease ABC subunit A